MRAGPSVADRGSSDRRRDPADESVSREEIMRARTRLMVAVNLCAVGVSASPKSSRRCRRSRLDSQRYGRPAWLLPCVEHNPQGQCALFTAPIARTLRPSLCAVEFMLRERPVAMTPNVPDESLVGEARCETLASWGRDQVIGRFSVTPGSAVSSMSSRSSQSQSFRSVSRSARTTPQRRSQPRSTTTTSACSWCSACASFTSSAS